MSIVKTAYIFVSGSVQGIGYRQFVKSTAKRHRVVGWVRNLSDGRVEAVLQGLESNVKKVIEDCKKGPFLAEVKRVEVTWEESSDNFDDFVIMLTT